MIDFIKGQIYAIEEKAIGVLIGNVAIKFSTPRANEWILNENVTIYTYLHWNAEQGPSLFGFVSAFERTVFLLIIDCPKIGPTIALNVLHQLKPGQFLEIVTSQNEKGLSSVNGIGAKKAEQIIMELKHKVTKLTNNGTLTPPANSQDTFMHWHEVSEVLNSLNYSKQEIHKTLQILTKKYADQQVGLDQLIRAALAQLSSTSNTHQT